jgi:hypothetical protein
MCTGDQRRGGLTMRIGAVEIALRGGSDLYSDLSVSAETACHRGVVSGLLHSRDDRVLPRGSLRGGFLPRGRRRSRRASSLSGVSLPGGAVRVALRLGL